MIDYEIESLELDYPYIMSIEREVEKENEHGVTIPAEPETVTDNIRCDYAVSSSFNATQTASVNGVNYSGIVFCSPLVDIHTGDTIHLEIASNKRIQFETGEPIYYSCHWEIPVLRKEKGV
ncbi:hypothetical protein EEL31_23845 [Brevibacillus laterosporus]|nr:hypothetical protein [Brevibacillus laterosporus]TPG71164.1 hypothetical protein EEL31_23845 [Brevibacillus laterosporus]